SWDSSGRVENRLSPALPHQTVHAVFPHTAFRCSSRQGMCCFPARPCRDLRVRSCFLTMRKIAIACRLPPLGHVGVKRVHAIHASPPLGLLLSGLASSSLTTASRSSNPHPACNPRPPVQASRAVSILLSPHMFPLQKIGRRTRASVDFGFG